MVAEPVSSSSESCREMVLGELSWVEGLVWWLLEQVLFNCLDQMEAG